MNQELTYPYTSEKQKNAREGAKVVYGLPYVLCVLGFSIPTIVKLIGDGDFNANVGIFLLKMSTLFTLMARPFSLILWGSNGTNTFLDQIFNQGSMLWEDIETIYPETAGTGAENMFNSFIDMPNSIFLLPVVFYLIACVFLGYKVKRKKNVAVEGFKFAASIYLSNIGAYVLFWGIAGVLNGFWIFDLVLANLLSAWFTGCLDFLAMIIGAVVLGTIGKKIAELRPPSSNAAAAYLVGSLQEPSPRFLINHRGKKQATREVAGLEKIGDEHPKLARYCDFCGAKVDPTARFCAGCGVSLNNDRFGRPTSGEAVQIDGHPDRTPNMHTPEHATTKVDYFERKMMAWDGISTKWSTVLMGGSVIFSIICLSAGFFQGFAYGLLSLPLGFASLMKDRNVFSKWIFERNYASRGVDLIIWGALGSLCAGAGLMLLFKGVLMLLTTQKRRDEYPKLTNTQWQARVFQASSTAASTLILLGTVLGISSIFSLNTVVIILTIIATGLGIISWFMYTHLIKPEFTRGNIYGMQIPVMVAGIVGMFAFGAGALILLQGILITHQKEGYEMKKEKEARENQPVEE
ncbi:MAG: zinc ribbon domain-containing protein [Promethearchaeota archaeon]